MSKGARVSSLSALTKITPRWTRALDSLKNWTVFLLIDDYGHEARTITIRKHRIHFFQDKVRLAGNTEEPASPAAQPPRVVPCGDKDHPKLTLKLKAHPTGDGTMWGLHARVVSQVDTTKTTKREKVSRNVTGSWMTTIKVLEPVRVRTG